MKPHLAPFTQAGPLIFLSGQLPFNSDGQTIDGDIGQQTIQTLQNLERVLTSLGLNRLHIVKATVWLRPGADFVAFNQSYHGSTQGALSIIGDEY